MNANAKAANACAFDGASKGWRHMVGERQGEVLAGSTLS